MRIPRDVIVRCLNVEEHEVIYDDGGYSALTALFPYMKGNWRIKVRLTKKTEVRTWKNAKGEGMLQNVEIMDE